MKAYTARVSVIYTDKYFETFVSSTYLYTPDQHKSNIDKWDGICSHKHMLMARDCNIEKNLFYFTVKATKF